MKKLKKLLRLVVEFFASKGFASMIQVAAVGDFLAAQKELLFGRASKLEMGLVVVLSLFALFYAWLVKRRRI